MTSSSRHSSTEDAVPRLVQKNDGLVASNIGKRGKTRPVLRDVSLAVQRGEAGGLLGPNGAGKTTFLKILTGQITATEGEASIFGMKIGENVLDVKRVIASILLVDDLRIKKN